MSLSLICSKYTPAVANLGYALQAFVVEMLPDAIEEIDLPANMLAYGYGPGYKNMVCTIIASKTMMKLGLYKGAELPDPAGLLKGSGKVHKYVEIKAMEDITRPEVRDLLLAAKDAWKKRTQ